MARLYYEPSKAPTPKEINDELEANLPGRDASTPPSGSGGNKTSNQLEKVAKLIPSEVIAAYLAMFGFVPLVQNEGLHRAVFWIIFTICLIATPIYLNYQAEKGRPKFKHLLISTVAFIVWAYTTTGSTLVPTLFDAAMGSIILVAFSLFSAVVPLDK
jgi:hypothetical protein